MLRAGANTPQVGHVPSSTKPLKVKPAQRVSAGRRALPRYHWNKAIDGLFASAERFYARPPVEATGEKLDRWG